MTPLVRLRPRSQIRLTLLLAVGAAALAPVALAGAPNVEVNVVVDMTPDGHKVPPPSASHPAYYVPALAQYKEMGATVAGEPPPPPPREIAHLLAVGLANQGYFAMDPHPHVNAAGEVTYADGTVVRVPIHPHRGQPLVLTTTGDGGGGQPLTMAMIEADRGPYSRHHAATVEPAHLAGGNSDTRSLIAQVLTISDPAHGPIMKGMPTLILAMHYGSLNPIIEHFPGMGKVFFNQNEMLSLVGGNTLDHLDLDFEREPVMQGAEQDRYFVSVSAYDFAAYIHFHKKVLLWQAKMSVPANRVYFADVVSTLVKTGAPYFGRETYRPKQFIEPATPEGTVQVGEPRVKE